jgi:hypothetical protein
MATPDLGKRLSAHPRALQPTLLGLALLILAFPVVGVLNTLTTRAALRADGVVFALGAIVISGWLLWNGLPRQDDMIAVYENGLEWTKGKTSTRWTWKNFSTVRVEIYRKGKSDRSPIDRIFYTFFVGGKQVLMFHNQAYSDIDGGALLKQLKRAHTEGLLALDLSFGPNRTLTRYTRY